MLAYQPVRALAGLNIGLNEGFTAATRIYKILDTQNYIKDKIDAKELNLSNGDIEFKNVTMEYKKGIPIIKNINLKFGGNSRSALVGLSGGGKSTILNLIPRFFNIQKGEITIDNQNISDVKVSSLRRHIALVSQDIILFDDTIKNNLLYGNILATEEQIIEASKKANCHEFILNFKDGYDTRVGENGVKLSGGQKQRVSIARAILKNSSIILLDEATSALDTDSEKKVQEALNNLTTNKTTITIAHRLSTVKNSDVIYVIDNGEVIESGSHNELLEKRGAYKNLCDQQSLA